MPQSRHRQKHHHHTQPQSHHGQAKHHSNKTASVMAIFLGFLGMMAAFLISEANLTWTVAGAVTGALIGFVVGRSFEKA